MLRNRVSRRFEAQASGMKARAAPLSVTPTLKTVQVTDEYDFIVVGLGYAGAILTARLAERNPDAKILAIEYGGPVQAKTGGASTDMVDIDMTADMFQSAGTTMQGGNTPTYNPNSPLCMPDVPGNYNNVAFRPLSDGYHLEEFPACFQGTGLGGNGVYNGALYQEPADWWWNDEIFTDIFLTKEQIAQGLTVSEFLAPYFQRVQDVLRDAIKSSPSMDGIHYNHGLYDLVKPYLEKCNFNEVPPDIPQLEKAGERFFTVPTVNVHNGLRTGASAWLEMFIDDKGQVRKDKFPKLDVLMYTEVKKVIIDPVKKCVTGVNVVENVKGAKRGGLATIPESAEKVISVKSGGKVIMAAGALPTNRILYLSGVGPRKLHGYVGKGKDLPAFIVNNEAIGTTVTEHVTTSLGFKYTGEDHPQPNNVHFDPADFNGNNQWLAKYARERVGPYCQYGPVVASHFICNPDLLQPLSDPAYKDPLQDGYVTTELFYNCFGAGPYPPVSNRALNPYNGPGTFTVYVMLLRPEMRAIFRVEPKDQNYNGVYTELYMADYPSPEDPTWSELNLPDYRALAKKDIATMTASVAEVLQITKDAKDIKVNLGPGDGNSTHLLVDCNGVTKSIADMDPYNIEDVKSYCTYWDGDSIVDGEYLAITHLEENHYCSTTPLSRNLDVFGNTLSAARKASYGVDPDTLEVKGASGLCVVDCGIFPKCIYCHPIGPVMAIAEWAADQISPPTK